MSLYEKVQNWISRHPRTSRIVKDIHYRTTVTVLVSLVINIVFAVYNCLLGIYTSSAWFITMCFYYLLLGFMRFYVVLFSIKTRGKDIPASIEKEYKLMRTDGIVFLFLPLALSGTVVLTIKQNHIRIYGTIIMLTIATYTFYKVIVAIINFIRIRKHHSPLLTTIRNISTADAAMSVLPLQTSMIASFRENSAMDLHLMTVLTGTGICFVLIGIGLSMIINARRNLKWLNQSL